MILRVLRFLWLLLRWPVLIALGAGYLPYLTGSVVNRIWFAPEPAGLTWVSGIVALGLCGVAIASAIGLLCLLWLSWRAMNATCRDLWNRSA